MKPSRLAGVWFGGEARCVIQWRRAYGMRAHAPQARFQSPDTPKRQGSTHYRLPPRTSVTPTAPIGAIGPPHILACARAQAATERHWQRALPFATDYEFPLLHLNAQLPAP